MDKQPTGPTKYRGLRTFLHYVRWTQHLLAIIAEVLILLSFAMSGMDLSLGGVMAGIPLVKVLWAGMFALGIDTAFALSWVRLRQCVVRRQWLPFAWNMLLALSMSVIVFQPLAIQLLQQSLDLNFNQAVANLGINIVFLTYARSAVAVFLGAILAMTNVESDMTTHQSSDSTQPKRQFILIERLFQKVAPATSSDPAVSSDTTPPAQSAPITVTEESPAQITEQIELPSAQEVPTVVSDEQVRVTTPQERAQKISEVDLSGLSGCERVGKVLGLFPDVSDRELGKLSGVSAATAKKHREAFKLTPSSSLPAQVQTTKEGSR